MTEIAEISSVAFADLDKWIRHYGWEGYDPYDVRGQDWYLIFKGNTFFKRKLRGLLTRIEAKFSPVLLRRLLKIERRVNAKSVGLLLSAYVSAYRATGDASLLVEANKAVAWLTANTCSIFSGASWGYPFHWHSRILIPRGTPSVVVTGTVGFGLLDYYELTGDQKVADLLNEVAKFFLDSLNRPVENSEHLCFSYTPLDNFRVLNATLFAGAFFARLSRMNHCEVYSEIALKNARYVISQQEADGSFHYWADEPDTVIDHYHTGFVLRHLDTINDAVTHPDIYKAVEKGYRFYLHRLFTSRGIPKHTPDRRYPIDIHSCAEALICISQFCNRFGGEEQLKAVLHFTLSNMRHKEGWFIYRIVQKNSKKHRVDIPYMRWGQSWMLLALSNLLREEQLCA